RLSESLVSVPRGNFRNATQLAEAAGVSLMSAFRFVSQLAIEGFLDEDAGFLHVVRVDELLERWVSANRQPAQEIAARWIVKRELRQLYADIAKRGRVPKAQPRCCIGLFAAADALGFGFVRGVPPHLYLERLDEDMLRRLGLMMAGSHDRADVSVRIPINREAIFRAAVMRDGLPLSDVLQVWLDVSAHPARGREQAAEIRRQALAPLFVKGYGHHPRTRSIRAARQCAPTVARPAPASVRRGRLPVQVVRPMWGWVASARRAITSAAVWS